MQFQIISLVVLSMVLSGCSSSPVQSSFEDNPIPNRIYAAGLNNTWKATLSALQDYSIKEKNREGGVIKTHWIDNTKEINFADAFDKGDVLHGARFRLLVNVFSGAFKGQESTRVTIRKRQQVEGDMMQGWRNFSEVDDIVEKTILYRIGRILLNEKKLEEIHQRKMMENSSESESGAADDNSLAEQPVENFEGEPSAGDKENPAEDQF